MSIARHGIWEVFFWSCFTQALITSLRGNERDRDHGRSNQIETDSHILVILRINITIIAAPGPRKDLHGEAYTVVPVDEGTVVGTYRSNFPSQGLATAIERACVGRHGWVGLGWVGWCWELWSRRSRTLIYLSIHPSIHLASDGRQTSESPVPQSSENQKSLLAMQMRWTAAESAKRTTSDNRARVINTPHISIPVLQQVSMWLWQKRILPLPQDQRSLSLTTITSACVLLISPPPPWVS